jgi:hypothetical protein
VSCSQELLEALRAPLLSPWTSLILHVPGTQKPLVIHNEKMEPTYLLPHLHDLEALKVVQSSPLGDGCALLGPGALIELLLDLVLFPLLRDVTDTALAGELGDDNGREGEFGERDLLARNGGLL